MADRERKVETHPSFGMIQFSRITGGTEHNFFGSSLRPNQWIRLRIAQGERVHDLGQDWYRGHGKQHIEVDLTAAQFADLLTTMNVGDGVPCTIAYLGGQSVEQAPFEKPVTARIHGEFKDRMRAIGEDYEKGRERVAEILQKPKIGKADREEIEGVLEALYRRLIGDSPFYLSQFEEGADKIVSQAKAEVDAFVTGMVQRTGMKALGMNVDHMQLEHRDE